MDRDAERVRAAAPLQLPQLAALVTAEGYRLQRWPEIGELQGFTRYADRVVSVRPDIDGAHATAVLAHELGHIRAGHGERDISRAQRETEAESIAYVVMAASGLDSALSAVPYVAGWSGGDNAVIGAAAETVHRAASGILTDLAHLAEDADIAPAGLAIGSPGAVRHRPPVGLVAATQQHGAPRPGAARVLGR